MALISILCPCYNEAENLPLFWRTLSEALGDSQYEYEYIFVNDGSSDGTLEYLKLLASENARVRAIDLSRNFGKEAALSAAIDFAAGDAVIPIDADLQDPPELIPEMLRLWQEGFDVVEAQRSDRASDTFGKRLTAHFFYRFHNKISSPKLTENAGDFRLMSRRVVDVIKKLPESQRFMRGLFAWAGFKTTVVQYVRPPRPAGETKYNYKSMWRLALDAITSFSTLPLRLWSYIGAAISMTAFLGTLYIFVRTLVFGKDLPGYASTICLILFLGGVQLLGIGILGEYLGRTYMEVKHRPLYVVADIYGENEGGDEKK